MTTGELEHFQSMWATEDLPFDEPTPWTLGRQVDMIAAAGFDGVAVDLGARQVASAHTMGPLVRSHSLKAAVFAFVASDAELGTALRYAHDIEADRMVVCAKLFDYSPHAAAGVLSRWYAIATAHGVELELETHRNTVTNDLRFTSHLIDYLDPRMFLAVDLSHFVCANEFPDAPDADIEHHVSRILDRAGSLQGRIASRSQVQVPLGYPQHRRWEERFRAWWTAGFAAIRARGGAPMFCTELGPPPYAWTDRNGAEVSDRWAEALMLRNWATDAFALSAPRPEELLS